MSEMIKQAEQEAMATEREYRRAQAGRFTCKTRNTCVTSSFGARCARSAQKTVCGLKQTGLLAILAILVILLVGGRRVLLVDSITSSDWSALTRTLQQHTQLTHLTLGQTLRPTQPLTSTYLPDLTDVRLQSAPTGSRLKSMRKRYPPI